MNKITEIIPDDMPEWAKEAMADGQLWNRVFGRIEELQDFCIWLTGCGYDFSQHDYFIHQRDKLLKDYKIGPMSLPEQPE